MKAIIKSRGNGKTTDLIKLADNRNGYIICSLRSRADQIMRQAYDMECNINFPISFREFEEGSYHDAGIGKFYIDDADQFLQYLTPVPIEAITITLEESTKGKVDDE